MATPMDTPAPLRLPAILQNPISSTQRHVEAHNAQQREKLAARRDAKAKLTIGASCRGKRVVRRIDNAAFIDNPHIVAPRRTDLLPSVPLHHRPSRPSFPPSALDRSTSIPGAAAPDRDPFSESSVNGAFTTSLKGTRALLRKRGQRAEGVVGRVEAVVRGWLGGEVRLGEGGGGEWKVVDEVLVDVNIPRSGDEDVGGGLGTSPTLLSSSSGSASRRLPPQHRVDGALPPLPLVHYDRGPTQVPAVLELLRSVAHLTLAAADPFDRLVIHLLARYYECLSWSEEHTTSLSQAVRLTHLVIPSITRPRPTATHNLLTPETTDISDLSGLSSSERTASESGAETETETERGTEVDPDETFRVEDGNTLDSEAESQSQPSLSNGLHDLQIQDQNQDRANGYPDIDSDLDLTRVQSAGSSMYASSEADSEYSSIGGMGDSMTFPPIPPGSGWVERDNDGSEFGSVRDFTRGDVGASDRRGAGQVKRDTGWADRLTFFEYLYGA